MRALLHGSQVRGTSVDELAARDAAKSMFTFTATEDNKLLDMMRRKEFESAGKILHDHYDRSTIARLVKEKTLDKEMRRVKQQVRQCLKEVIDDLGYQPTLSEQAHERTHNPRAFCHLKKRNIPFSQTKIDDHIGTLPPGRAHVKVFHVGKAYRCVRSIVTTHGRWYGLEIRAIMFVGWCNRLHPHHILNKQIFK